MAGVSPPNFPEYRLTDDASRLAGALVGAAILIAIAVGIRLVMAGLIDDPVHPVTYAGLVGGFLGAVAMALGMQVMRVRANLPTTDFLTKTFGDRFEDPGSYVYGGTALHLVYGGIAGSLYPRLMKTGFGLHGSEFVAFPSSMLYTVLFGVALFVLGSVFAGVGVFDLDVDPSDSAYRRFLVLHLVYGVVLGATMGIWWVL